MCVRTKMSNILITILIVLAIISLTMLLYVCIHTITSTNTNIPTENDTLTTVDEAQNSLHRTSNEDSGIIRTNTTIEL